MKSHEAMKEAAGEQRTSVIAEIAHRMRIKPSTAYKWTQPSEDPTDSGNRNPVDLITQWIESCLILGRPKHESFAPLRHLNQHFKQIVFSLPDSPCPSSEEDLSAALIGSMKEFGDIVSTHEQAMKDRKISKNEFKQIEREVWEQITQVLFYLHCAKEMAK